jgi:hypothetical protein
MLTVYAAHTTVPSDHRKVRIWWQAIVLQVIFHCVQMTRNNVHYIYSPHNGTFVPHNDQSLVSALLNFTKYQKTFWFVIPITSRPADHFYMLGRFFSPSYCFRLLVRSWSRQNVLLLCVQIYCNGRRWAFKTMQCYTGTWYNSPCNSCDVICATLDITVLLYEDHPTLRFCSVVVSVSASGSCRLVIELVWVISFSAGCIHLWLKWVETRRVKRVKWL